MEMYRNQRAIELAALEEKQRRADYEYKMALLRGPVTIAPTNVMGSVCGELYQLTSEYARPK